MGLKREYYSSAISSFLTTSANTILSELMIRSDFPVEQTQKDSWLEEITLLQRELENYQGSIFFEYSVPRMGRRIDVLLIIGAVIFVVEFKVGESRYNSSAIDQVWDYALDLKNFHETSHTAFIAPILVATLANATKPIVELNMQNDKVFKPIKCNSDTLRQAISMVLDSITGDDIDPEFWAKGSYRPTPTIIEAARALYKGHSVGEISRSDSSAINLTETSDAISEIIRRSREGSQKAICFVTGVPGSGKTLVGLNIATKHNDRNSDTHSVYLSGNGPLVAILREALARDKANNERERGRAFTRADARREVKLFIQNVHNFRDECLIDRQKPPLEHVALFDEAQRAWNLQQTESFMRRKKKYLNFDKSEPEFLISCLNRHTDWAVVVCLVGGGQEINTGEAGIGEWIRSIIHSFPDWNIYISSRLSDSEYGAGIILEEIRTRRNVSIIDELHLAVSMRSFRAENVSLLIKQLLDLEDDNAHDTLKIIGNNYPIVITRDLSKAKGWLQEQARGSERYGIVVSSQAERLKPYAIDVKSPMDPIHWFLDGKEDVRSSYYLEDVATEFDIQGLELDWTCVTWDADFRHTANGWEHWSFVGDRWNRIRKPERQVYLKNAYRVLLTRARQGMVIVVPPGSDEDLTRKREYYNNTYAYLQRLGFEVL